MKYLIEVHALGYTDHAKSVDGPLSSSLLKQFERQAKEEWCEANDIGIDSVELAFTRITKLPDE
jgi:hypothetical protein